MRIPAFLAAALLSAAAFAQNTVTVPISGGSVTLTLPPGIVGPAGPQGPQGPAGTAPTEQTLAAALLADSAFVKALQAALTANGSGSSSGGSGSSSGGAGGSSSSSSGGSSSSSSSSSSGGSGSSSSGGGTVTQATTCTGVKGPLTLNASLTRPSGIAPLLQFFDATATTDTAVTGGYTAFQHVTITWNFGDPSTATWLQGSLPGQSNRNLATGGIAAHVYNPPTDTPYSVSVTANDGTNSATCSLGFTAYAAAGANGFASAKTTCVSSSATPTAGSGDCPAGANVLKSASFNTALAAPYFGSAKRVLFKCGDSFTGDNAVLKGVGWSVGAYGGCQGTKVNRPVLTDSGTNGELTVDVLAGDGRIADLDLEGAGKGAYAAETDGGNQIPYQITLLNLNSTGNNANFAWSHGAQWGLIDSAMNCMRTSVGTYANYSGNTPSQWTGNKFNNLDYQAFLGNLLNGCGGTNNGAGQEAVRFSAGRLIVIQANTFENANSVGALLKIHNGNPSNPSVFSGVYTEFLEIAENWFGGTSGSQAIENAPQNGGNDERLRNIVFERNLVTTGPGGNGGKLLVSAVNETVRNNVFYTPSGVTPPVYYPIDVARRGVEPQPTGIEAYGNTCYLTQYCVGFDGLFYGGPPANSSARGNLYYSPNASWAAVIDKGTGDTVSNNTTATTTNPNVVNGAKALSVLTDFKPTAGYSGGITLPGVLTDALGVPRPAAPDLGAIQH